MKTAKLKEGTITYRKSDNRYMGRYRDNDGSCRCVYAKTYGECLKKLKDALAYRDRYLSHINFFEWLDDWIENYKRPNVKESTLYAIDVVVRVHIKKRMRNRPLVEINGLELQKFLIKMENSRTRKAVYDVLNESFKQAYALRLIDFNPMLAVKIPAHKQNKGSELTSVQLSSFLEKIKDHITEKYFKFLLYTGCRRSEALSLKWSDIDFEKKLLHIPGTKTQSSDRTIPLFDNVEELLKSMPITGDNVFYFRADYVTHVFKEFCPEHKLHDLRHTFATRCIELGIQLKVIQVWLGHSKLDTTADIYSHVTKSIHTAEAAKLKNAFE